MGIGSIILVATGGSPFRFSLSAICERDNVEGSSGTEWLSARSLCWQELDGCQPHSSRWKEPGHPWPRSSHCQGAVAHGPVAQIIRDRVAHGPVDEIIRDRVVHGPVARPVGGSGTVALSPTCWWSFRSRRVPSRHSWVPKTSLRDGGTYSAAASKQSRGERACLAMFSRLE